MRIQLYLIAILVLLGCSSKNSTTSDSEPKKEQPHFKTQSEIEGKWILNSGFSDENLVFLKEEILDTNEQWLKQFTFKSNDLKFKYLRTFPRCGNGIVTIDSCFWKIRDDKIELYLAGHEVEYRFVNHAIYTQKPGLKHEIVLMRDSMIKSEYEDMFNIKIE